MKVTLGKKILSAVLCGPLVALTTPIDASAAMAFQSQSAASAPDYSGQGTPQTAAELQGLVAPIALYPDALVAQILSASTFPDQAYETMNRWRKQPDGGEVLVVGSDNNPFPIPLTKTSGGQWSFDIAAGKGEILARRVGDNELATIDVMNAMADAQAQYLALPHDGVKQYAQKFVSDEGKQNGLYWKSAEGKPRSPLGPLVAFASTEEFTPQAGKQQPYHGYFYRMLTNRAPMPKAARKITSSTER
jgi:hypothetical protein